MTERSLFDALDEPTFRLVPHATFLSWDDATRRRYCALRDRDSARDASSDWWRDFYLERAASYES